MELQIQLRTIFYPIINLLFQISGRISLYNLYVLKFSYRRSFLPKLYNAGNNKQNSYSISKRPTCLYRVLIWNAWFLFHFLISTRYRMFIKENHRLSVKSITCYKAMLYNIGFLIWIPYIRNDKKVTYFQLVNSKL